MRPYPPILRNSIVEQLNDHYGGGLALTDGSGLPLQLRLTRKEQVSVHIVSAQ